MTTYDYAQLEGLWIQAGGPKKMASVMAAIAEAESGGRSDAHNPSGASGLWQILGQPFPGNVFDPLTNARMAVAKWKSQGLGAWVTWTSGAYKQFLKGGVSATVPPGGTSSGATGGSGGGGGLLGLPGEVISAFAMAGTALDWLLQPSHWVRIFAGFAGIVMMFSGVWVLSHVGGEVG